MAGYKDSLANLPETKKFVEEVLEKEPNLKNIFLLGTGGTYSYALPYAFFGKQLSDFPVYAEIAPEIYSMNNKHLGADSLCVFCSATGNTKDILKAMDYTHSKGARNLAFVSVEGSPMEPKADYIKVVDGGSIHFNLAMLLLTLKAFNRAGDFPKYEEFANSIGGIGQYLDDARALTNSRCIYHAARNAFADFHYVVGAGATYGEAYCYGMCIMEEMQWMRTKIIHAAEFFHGAIELCEKDTPCILLKGEDAGRDLVTRVENFLKPLTDEVLVMDSKEVALPCADEFRYLLSPVVVNCMISPLSKALEVERNHSLKVRRYYRQMEY